MMNRRLLRLLPILLLLLLVVPTVLAAERIDSDGQVPFYARVPRGDIIHNDEWAVIVFYRPASCIPADFNLLDFFDYPNATGPGAFGCNPPTTDSLEFWRNGPGIDFAPVVARFRGLGAVPIWFVGWPELEAAVADDMLTLGELEALPSLRQGSADFYRETLRPGESPSTRPAGIQFTARGELTDDSRFLARVSIVEDGMNRVRVRFLP